eukprot:TRINITY_DN3169_c0_g1_i1.p1 TRINITY_DN3169_c0_g1~~TRINITY_DN3169_c0_g1_i1.p1  ORF type:complete len:273 (-),score=28.18 TRINITY_DN3169_c0_g1_i1:220-936(-)
MACTVKTFQARAAAAPRASRSVAVRAADRPMWLPGMNPPSHLDGSMPGDFGFDPLNLGMQGEDRLKWYAEAEKTNGRWAMAGVAGIMGQELLGVTPKWFEAGAKKYDIDFLPLLAIEFAVLGFLELKRYQGFKNTGSSGLINQFPFDPVGMNSPSMQLKEIKNGRLAMVAFVGFCVQALVTREGPIEGLFSHLANPFGANITTSLLNLPEVIGKQTFLCVVCFQIGLVLYVSLPEMHH